MKHHSDSDWGAIPPDHASPGVNVVSHLDVEVPQQNIGVPGRGTMQHPQQGHQEGWVLCTTAGTVRDLCPTSLMPVSRVGPWLRRTGRRHVPRFCGPREGVLNRSLSDPSPRAYLPWEDPTRGIKAPDNIPSTLHLIILNLDQWMGLAQETNCSFADKTWPLSNPNPILPFLKIPPLLFSV
ncbi:hypothetical protein ATANTOWER_015658 [Ataeniobius toweri]|uniref:Uncharacterized protein n=1 Tax=Ataeniobius toweri TaxID=208326 RepID=A0ABU7CHA8_9TELE|nr:hypothetical protein [Ataeniobius toweri]